MAQKSLLKKLFDFDGFRFILVGIANTVVGTIIMFGAYNIFHLNYWVSSSLNYICGSILSYFLNKYFTFKNHERSIQIVVRFIINILVCYLLAYGIAKPAVRAMLSSQSKVIQENAAMLVGMVLFTVLNYFGQKFFAFKKTEQ